MNPVKTKLLNVISEFCRDNPVNEKATDGVVELSYAPDEKYEFVYVYARDLLGFPLAEVTFDLRDGVFARTTTIGDPMNHRVLVQQRIKALQLTLKLLDKVADELAVRVDF